MRGQEWDKTLERIIEQTNANLRSLSNPRRTEQRSLGRTYAKPYILETSSKIASSSYIPRDIYRQSYEAPIRAQLYQMQPQSQPQYIAHIPQQHIAHMQPQQLPQQMPQADFQQVQQLSQVSQMPIVPPLPPPPPPPPPPAAPNQLRQEPQLQTQMSPPTHEQLEALRYEIKSEFRAILESQNDIFREEIMQLRREAELRVENEGKLTKGAEGLSSKEETKAPAKMPNLPHETAHLDSEVSLLKTTLTGLQSTVAALKEKEEDKADPSTAVHDLQEQISDLQSAMARLTGKEENRADPSIVLQDLQKQVLDLKKVMSDLTEKEAKSAEPSTIMQDLEKQVSDLKKVTSDLREKEENRASPSTIMQDLQKQVSDLKNVVSDLTEKEKSRPDPSTIMQDLQKQVSDLKNVVSDLTEQVYSNKKNGPIEMSEIAENVLKSSFESSSGLAHDKVSNIVNDVLLSRDSEESKNLKLPLITEAAVRAATEAVESLISDKAAGFDAQVATLLAHHSKQSSEVFERNHNKIIEVERKIAELQTDVEWTKTSVIEYKTARIPSLSNERIADLEDDTGPESKTTPQKSIEEAQGKTSPRISHLSSSMFTGIEAKSVLASEVLLERLENSIGETISEMKKMQKTFDEQEKCIDERFNVAEMQLSKSSEDIAAISTSLEAITAIIWGSSDAVKVKHDGCNDGGAILLRLRNMESRIAETVTKPKVSTNEKLTSLQRDRSLVSETFNDPNETSTKSFGDMTDETGAQDYVENEISVLSVAEQGETNNETNANMPEESSPMPLIDQGSNVSPLKSTLMFSQSSTKHKENDDMVPHSTVEERSISLTEESLTSNVSASGETKDSESKTPETQNRAKDKIALPSTGDQRAAAALSKGSTVLDNRRRYATHPSERAGVSQRIVPKVYKQPRESTQLNQKRKEHREQLKRDLEKDNGPEEGNVSFSNQQVASLSMPTDDGLSYCAESFEEDEEDDEEEDQTTFEEDIDNKHEVEEDEEDEEKENADVSYSYGESFEDEGE